MKKMYIKPENTVVEINLKETLLQMSEGEGENGGEANSREVVFSQESINSRNAWDNEW
jgi:hypothetical protein